MSMRCSHTFVLVVTHVVEYGRQLHHLQRVFAQPFPAANGQRQVADPVHVAVVL